METGQALGEMVLLYQNLHEAMRSSEWSTYHAFSKSAGRSSETNSNEFGDFCYPGES